ncbi:MAG: histidine ammonia-lyase [Bacteroidota bacterium]
MHSIPHIFHYGEHRLTIEIALSLCSGETKGVLTSSAIQRIDASRAAVDEIVDRQLTVYGINTGFGSLCTTRISGDQVRQLQHNILKSHSVGTGPPIPLEIAKMMLILKVQSLSYGYSGICLTTLERILWHIEQEIIPLVPSQGSVGASGDLAPLSHLFLPLIGGGKCWYKDKWTDTAEILKQEGKEPLSLDSKEGLALINGTQFMAAFGVNIVDRLFNCLQHADIISAMMIEALLGSRNPFQPELHNLRPYGGNQEVARRIFRLLDNSEILHSHLNCGKVQDPYSLRCIPQVHGASRNAWQHLREMIEVELNSVTDNPLIFSADHTISGGNFHGQPIALPMDYATLAAAEIGNISDRRIYLSLLGESEGLPKLLMKHTGLNSGFMLVQYTSAALVSENKSLCYPASADSIPTSLGQEDHVSMGAISGRKALQVIENVERILAIELLCASQAFDYRRPLKSSSALEACHHHIRQHIDHVEEDRVFSDDIDLAYKIIQGKMLRKLTEPFLSHQPSGETS